MSYEQRGTTGTTGRPDGRPARAGLPTKAWWQALCGWLEAIPGLEPLRRQRPRRTLVVAFALVVAAFPLAGWVGGLPGLLVMLVPYGAGSVLLAFSTQGMLDRPQRSLDERQLHLRRTLFREPYLMGVTLGLVGGLIVAAARSAAGPIGLQMLVVTGLYGLPSMVLAWRLPDGLDDDGLESDG